LGGLLELIGRYGYLVVFFGVMLESAGVPLPGETILLASGALAHRGVLSFGDALVFGILGAVVGDQIGYWAGRLGGRPFLLRWGRYVRITPGRLGHAEAFFARHGGRAVFLARFVAGLRVFGAGWLRVRAACRGGGSPSSTRSAERSGRRRPSLWAISCGPT
jgi:membrane protein DedA with SNARE-associated domain